MILSPDVESLFHQAMLQPAHARLRWLEACTEWRGDVVETVRKMIEALPAVSQSNATHPVHGERRGEFTLMGLLGYGSHGSVFLARRDSMPNRVIALKVLPISSSSTLVARFRTEHTALALLDHPGIVGILDVGRFADGEHWIAMPFVPGEPITSFAHAQALSALERVSLVLQVCDAVAFAHQRGLIHRDIKPFNVLTIGERTAPRAIVIDFGLAKLLDTQEGDTLPGIPLGTPEYMAPEQASCTPATTLVDVYGLGSLLHTVLANGPRRTRASLDATGLPLALAIVDAIPERLTDAPPIRAPALAQLSKRRLRELEAIVEKATRALPSERYPSVQAFANDLRLWLTGESPSAASPSMHQALRSLARTHKRAFAAMTVGATVLILGLATSLVVSAQAEASRKRWEGLYEFSRGMLVNSDLSAMGSDSMPRLRATAQATQRRFPVGSGDMMEELLLAEALATTGMIEVAEDYAVSALERLREAGAGGLPVARASMLIASARAKDHDWPASIAMRHEAMEQLRPAVEPSDRRRIELELINLALGVPHEVLGSIDAIEQYRDQLARTLEATDPLYLRACVSAAVARTWTGNPDTCLLASQQAASDCIRILGHRHPLTLKARSNLVLACAYSGLNVVSVEMCPDLFTDIAEGYGRSSSSYVELQSNYGSTLHDLGRNAEARVQLEEAYQGFLRIYGSDHPRTQLTEENLKNVLVAMGRADQGQAHSAEPAAK